jgi:hypothetical protein
MLDQTGFKVSSINAGLNTANTNLFEVNASGSKFHVQSNGRVNMSSLPTSSAGLSAGDLWNNAGVINIV